MDPIIIRVLAPSEYPRLLGLPLVDAVPDPEHSRVVVAEHDGNIVGYWMAVEVVHLEPLWVHPKWRKKGLAVELWQALKRCLDACRVRGAFSHVREPSLVAWAMNLGFTPLRGATLLEWRDPREAD